MQFYKENSILPESTTLRGKVVYPRTHSHLSNQFDYYVHRDLPIVIGVYQFEHIKSRQTFSYDFCEVLDLNTGLMLSIDHPFNILSHGFLVRNKLNAAFSYMGTFNPLDPELQEAIRKKRNQRNNNNK